MFLGTLLASLLYIVYKNISSFVHYILPSGIFAEIWKKRKRQSERIPLRKTFVFRYAEPNVKRSPSSRIDAWTIRRLRELKNCYSRASGLILRQIASETFPPEISTRGASWVYLSPSARLLRPSWLSFPQFDSQNSLQRLWKHPTALVKVGSPVHPLVQRWSSFAPKRLHNEHWPERGKAVV